MAALGKNRQVPAKTLCGAGTPRSVRDHVQRRKGPLRGSGVSDSSGTAGSPRRHTALGQAQNERGKARNDPAQTISRLKEERLTPLRCNSHLQGTGRCILRRGESWRRGGQSTRRHPGATSSWVWPGQGAKIAPAFERVSAIGVGMANTSFISVGAAIRHPGKGNAVTGGQPFRWHGPPDAAQIILQHRQRLRRRKAVLKHLPHLLVAIARSSRSSARGPPSPRPGAVLGEAQRQKIDARFVCHRSGRNVLRDQSVAKAGAIHVQQMTLFRRAMEPIAATSITQ